MEYPGRFRQGDRVEATLVEEVAESGRHFMVGSFGSLVGSLSEVTSDPRRDRCEHRLSLERVVGIAQQAVEPIECSQERGILDVGVVDRSADQLLVQDLGPDIKNPLAEAGSGRGPSVVDDVRRQDGHSGAGGTTVPGFEVVADRSFVHDEDRPGVVRVRGVRVIDEVRVEDLADARHRWLPGANPLTVRGQEASIVQDPHTTRGLDRPMDIGANG